MTAATGLHCAGVVPGPLGELLQWAAASSYASEPFGVVVDDDELLGLIEEVEMYGRQSMTLQSVRSVLHQWTVGDVFTVAQEWWSTTTRANQQKKAKNAQIGNNPMAPHSREEWNLAALLNARFSLGCFQRDPGRPPGPSFALVGCVGAPKHSVPTRPPKALW